MTIEQELVRTLESDIWQTTQELSETLERPVPSIRRSLLALERQGLAIRSTLEGTTSWLLTCKTTCSKCRKVSAAIEADFGYRTVPRAGGPKKVPQSWCRVCRKAGKEA